MAYNFAFKVYSNGSVQLTYYSKPILDSIDKDAFKYKKDYDDDYMYQAMNREYERNLDLYSNPFSDDFVIVDDYSELAINRKTDALKDLLSDEELDARKRHSINSALNRSKNKIYDYGRDNKWDWFLTFTLNEDVVQDRTDYRECSKKVIKWFHRVRERKCPDIRYLVIPERHPSSGAWHFHALVSNVEELKFEIALNNQEYRKNDSGNLIIKKGKPVLNKYFGQHLRTSYPNGDYIYNIKDYKNGWTTATRIKDSRKAVSYIAKYITKELCECAFGCSRYYHSDNLTLPYRELGLFDKEELPDLITFIEYTYGVKLSTDYLKTLTIDCGGYKQNISYMEFG